MALVVRYSTARPAVRWKDWMCIIMLAVLVHVVPFTMGRLGIVPLTDPNPEAPITLDLSSLPDDPAQLVSAKPPPPLPKPEAQPAKPPPPLPEEQKAKPPAEAPPAPEKSAPQPEKKAEPVQAPKPETPKPEAEQPKTEAAKPIPAPPSAESTIAFGNSKPDAEAPKDPKYLSDRNSIASDHGPKNLPLGDAFNAKGDSEIVKTLGRRGEDEDKNAKYVDPRAGSVVQAGTQVTGNPNNPDLALAPRGIPEKEPLPVEKKALSPDAEKLAPVPEPAMKPPEAKSAEIKPVANTPKGAGGVEGTGGAEKVTTIEGETLAEGPVARTKDIQTKIAGEKLDKPSAGTDVDAERDGKPPSIIIIRDPNAAKQNSKRPDPQTALEKPVDPELARILGLTGKGGSSGAQNTLKNNGQGTRAGDVGEEGDGRKRAGESDSVSDVVMVNLSTRAGKEGDVKFSAAANPEVMYLKPFFKRMDQKWKAELFSVNKVRVEQGSVSILIKFDKTGTLLEAKEVGRLGDISDEAVNLCRRGIKAASPHDPFPPNLGNRREVSVVVTFVY